MQPPPPPCRAPAHQHDHGLGQADDAEVVDVPLPEVEVRPVGHELPHREGHVHEGGLDVRRVGEAEAVRRRQDPAAAWRGVGRLIGKKRGSNPTCEKKGGAPPPPPFTQENSEGG